jgi:hypothetical protein
VKRTREFAGRTVLATAVLALGLTGCSAISPSVVKTYPASDGVAADLPGSTVALRNFLVVGSEKGSAAEVIGALVNSGTAPVQVSLQAAVGASAQPTQTVVTVPANSITQVGPDQTTTMEIADLAVVPGSVLGITAATGGGGRADLNVPVLLPQGEYASLTPAPAPTDTPTPSGTETPLDAATPSDSASPDASADPQSTTQSTAATTTKKRKAKRKQASSTATPTPTATTPS